MEFVLANLWSRDEDDATVGHDISQQASHLGVNGQVSERANESAQRSARVILAMLNTCALEGAVRSKGAEQ